MEATDFLNSLSAKELAMLRKKLAKDIADEEAAPEDKDLKEPIPFYNDKYRYERFFVKGRRKPIQFQDGMFVARTTAEAAALRGAGSTHIFEGDDLKAPMECQRCKRQFRNSQVYQYHMNHHNE